MEEIEVKHREEKQVLMAEIQVLKHSFPKNDKKKKKEVMATIAQMEIEMKKRHAEELSSCNNELTDEVVDGLKNVAINGSNSPAENEEPKRISKAQKRREKKIEKQKQRIDEISKQDEINLSGVRHVEILKLNKLLEEKGLDIHDIPSDGNCLYAAVSHQLSFQNIELSIQSLRKKTSNYMMKHVDDFLPFLCDTENSSPFTEEKYKSYCDEIATTCAWGGQLEIQAMSELLKRSIEIYQADIPVIAVGDKFKDTSCKISYHRHMYGLGEHYNSLVPSTSKDRQRNYKE